MASNIQPTGLDWKNLPDKTTPISAENLNKMANTIDDLVEAVNPLNTVEANPEGTPTEGLEKVEIDGTLYEVKGGHKILNDSGTTLAQKDNLQFKGVYTQNNGDNTEVDICRTMTKAQMEALTGEELKGFINTSDEPNGLPLTAEWVAYDSNTSVKEKIDELEQFWNASGSNCTDTTLTISLVKVGRIVFGNINDGNASASAGGVIAKFPSGFVPNSNSRCDFRDSYSQKRLQVKSEGIIAMESVNNILRGTFMYYV